MVWSQSKVNYRFIFEYNTRHTLEWRQLLEVSTNQCRGRCAYALLTPS